MRVHLTGMRGAGWINIHYMPCGFRGLSTSLVCGVKVYVASSCTGLRMSEQTKQPIIPFNIYICVERWWDIGSAFDSGCLFTYVFTHTFTLNSIWNRRKPVCAITCCLVYHGVVFGYTYFQMQHTFGTTNELLICSSDHLDPQDWTSHKYVISYFLPLGSNMPKGNFDSE